MRMEQKLEFKFYKNFIYEFLNLLALHGPSWSRMVPYGAIWSRMFFLALHSHILPSRTIVCLATNVCFYSTHATFAQIVCLFNNHCGPYQISLDFIRFCRGELVKTNKVFVVFLFFTTKIYCSESTNERNKWSQCQSQTPFSRIFRSALHQKSNWLRFNIHFFPPYNKS